MSGFPEIVDCPMCETVLKVGTPEVHPSDPLIQRVNMTCTLCGEKFSVAEDPGPSREYVD